jgi:poly(A) polymerase
MKSAGHMDPQPWMLAAPTRAVVAALVRDGQTVRFVGGSVRDALLGRPVQDVDIATPDPPETVMRLIADAGLTAIPTGIRHGTVTAVADGTPFEITTLRRDVETFGRHARVAYTDDWEVDAARRDFTFNAIFCGTDGTLFDPCGGIPDLRRGLVRFVGDPSQRIAEDVLRLLRYFRFLAHYGRAAPDAAALRACRDFAPKLPDLSGERVRVELLKLLGAPEPGSILDLMLREDILAHILPEATNIAALQALAKIENECGGNECGGEAGLPGVAVDPLRRLGAVLGPETAADPSALARISGRLKLSNAERQRLVLMLAPGALPGPDDPPPRRRAMLHRLGRALYVDRLFLAWAHERVMDPAGSRDAGFRDGVHMAEAWQPKDLPVTGADVQAQGIARGPEVGRLLAAIEDWWIEGDFAADRKAALAKLRALSAARGPDGH